MMLDRARQRETGPTRSGPIHWLRSASAGDTLVARSAGASPAAAATMLSTITAPPSATGSAGLTPAGIPCASAAEPTRSAVPMASPGPVMATTCPTTIRAAFPGAAPSAMRMPISWVRSLTA